MNPPSGGPSTGPISAGMVSQAIARTRSALAVARSRTRRPTGTIIAPPRPCSVRASTSCHTEVAKPHRMEPSTNTRDREPEHAARAEPVGDPAADRDEHREAEQVGGDREAEPQRAFAERRRDHRQRGGDRGRIQIFHEQGAGDDQRDQHGTGFA